MNFKWKPSSCFVCLFACLFDFMVHSIIGERTKKKEQNKVMEIKNGWVSMEEGIEGPERAAQKIKRKIF